MYYIDIEYWY